MRTKNMWHINDDGEVGRCSARFKCRFSKNGGHHDTAREAQGKVESLNVHKNAKITKKRSHKETPQSSVSAESSTSEKNGNELHTKNGRTYCYSYDYGNKQLYEIAFGDLTMDDEIREIHALDPTKDYQMGECGAIAQNIWNQSPHVEDYFIVASHDDQDFGVHQFVKLKDGTYADSMGIWTEDSIIQEWNESGNGEVWVKRFDYFDGSDEDVKPDPTYTTPGMDTKLLKAVHKMIDRHCS